MHIIIPMSGRGQRFIDAGYTDIKPLIIIDGKPIIEHVVDLFPNESKFSFICSQEHLDNTPIRSVLSRIRPSANIVGISPHKKGPVHAVTKIFDSIDDEEEVIVSYCDYGTAWDYQAFLNDVRSRKADGAIASYKGFHPHMLGSTNYAFMRDDGNRNMLQIKEKEPFTDNRMQEYASNGTYYFKYGAYVKKYFEQLVEQDVHLNGEYYVSLVYNLLVADKLRVSIYEIDYMLQWGTPDDVTEYKSWSAYFDRLAQKNSNTLKLDNLVKLIPLAGNGSRFLQEGYITPKPLIPVQNKPMIIQATRSLPDSSHQIFVCQEKHLNQYPLEKTLKVEYPHADIVSVSKVTSGQATSCSMGLKGTLSTQQLIIGACDNAMTYSDRKLELRLLDKTVDALIFTFKNHVSVKRNPHMYGYVATDENHIATRVSVKVPLSTSPEKDHALVGSFYFRSIDIFNLGYDSLVKNNVRVNNEFYVDSLMQELINLGYKVAVFQVDDYICFGTPDDLRTFEYWQAFFKQCNSHAYQE